MRRTALPLLALLAACTGGDAEGREPAAAQAVFSAFQAALRAGDEAAVARLLTDESRAVLPEIPWHEVRTRPELRPVGAVRHGYEWWVSVRDAGAGEDGATSVFVVARENGRLLLDLVATAGHHATVVARPGPPVMQPRPLSPLEIDRIRAMDAAAPR